MPAFSVQNNFEIKNGVRILAEDNILENSWGGFSQDGFGMLLTPKSQSNLCPVCYDADITFRYNKITGTADGIQLAPVASDTGGLAVGMERVSFHDIVIDGGYGGLIPSTVIRAIDDDMEVVRQGLGVWDY